MSFAVSSIPVDRVVDRRKVVTFPRPKELKARDLESVIRFFESEYEQQLVPDEGKVFKSVKDRRDHAFRLQRTVGYQTLKKCAELKDQFSNDPHIKFYLIGRNTPRNGVIPGLNSVNRDRRNVSRVHLFVVEVYGRQCLIDLGSFGGSKVYLERQRKPTHLYEKWTSSNIAMMAIPPGTTATICAVSSSRKDEILLQVRSTCEEQPLVATEFWVELETHLHARLDEAFKSTGPRSGESSQVVGRAEASANQQTQDAYKTLSTTMTTLAPVQDRSRLEELRRRARHAEAMREAADKHLEDLTRKQVLQADVDTKINAVVEKIKTKSYASVLKLQDQEDFESMNVKIRVAAYDRVKELEDTIDGLLIILEGQTHFGETSGVEFTKNLEEVRKLLGKGTSDLHERFVGLEELIEKERLETLQQTVSESAAQEAPAEQSSAKIKEQLTKAVQELNAAEASTVFSRSRASASQSALVLKYKGEVLKLVFFYLSMKQTEDEPVSTEDAEFLLTQLRRVSEREFTSFKEFKPDPSQRFRTVSPWAAVTEIKRACEDIQSSGGPQKIGVAPVLVRRFSKTSIDTEQVVVLDAMGERFRAGGPKVTSKAAWFKKWGWGRR